MYLILVTLLLSLRLCCPVDNTNIEALFPRFWENGSGSKKTSREAKNEKSSFLDRKGNFTVNIESDVDEIRLYLGEIKLNVDEITRDVGGIKLYVGNIAPDLANIRPDVDDYKQNVANITPYLGNYKRDVDEIKL